MRGTAFVLITFIFFRLVEFPYSDEAWLAVSLIGIAIAYSIKPCRKYSHLKCLAIYELLVVGMYVFGLKLPLLLSSFVAYRLASIGCISIYTTCYWFFLVRKLE
jgi:hypothetical protein